MSAPEPVNGYQVRQDAPRRARDRSVVLLVLGALLLLPPFATVSLVDMHVAGIPVPLLYVFAVWVVLIVGARVLARPLAESDQGREAGPPDAVDGA